MLAAVLLAGAIMQPLVFAWTPASGPVVAYDVACLDEIGVWVTCAEQVSEPSVEIRDLGIGESIQIRVRALDAAGNVGPPSQSSEVVRRLPLFDWDRNGMVGVSDYAALRRMIWSGLADAGLVDAFAEVWRRHVCAGVYRSEPCREE